MKTKKGTEVGYNGFTLFGTINFRGYLENDCTAVDFPATCSTSKYPVTCALANTH